MRAPTAVNSVGLASLSITQGKAYSMLTEEKVRKTLQYERIRKGTR